MPTDPSRLAAIHERRKDRLSILVGGCRMLSLGDGCTCPKCDEEYFLGYVADLEAALTHQQQAEAVYHDLIAEMNAVAELDDALQARVDAVLVGCDNGPTLCKEFQDAVEGRIAAEAALSEARQQHQRPDYCSGCGSYHTQANKPDSTCIASRDCLEKGTGIYAAHWQPIDTAPKDGTWVMTYGPSLKMRFYPFVAFYDHGWVGVTDEEHEFTPTHWMPLPNAPSAVSRPPREDQEPT